MDKYYVFAFSSRTDSMKFFQLLKGSGVYAQMINTPRIISLGCGLSVKVAPSYFAKSARLFRRQDYSSFLGAFEIDGSYRGGYARRVLS